MFNKDELARRFDCVPRTIDRYLKIQPGELIPKESSQRYPSKLDEFKEIIIDKIDTYGFPQWQHSTHKVRHNNITHSFIKKKLC